MSAGSRSEASPEAAATEAEAVARPSLWRAKGAIGFVSLFGFKYSPRPHTPALKLGDDVPEATKSERSGTTSKLSSLRCLRRPGSLPALALIKMRA